MTFSVYVDVNRWRRHLEQVRDARPGLVPVAKGNGYGLGNGRLAAEAQRLGVDALAVGTAAEVAEVVGVFDGDVLVLTPYQPGTDDGTAPQTHRVVRTVAHLQTLRDLPAGARVVVECRTSMHRHGLRPDDLGEVAGAIGAARLEGFALHLPLDRPGDVDPESETHQWVELLTRARLDTSTVWVSHLHRDELDRLRTRHPDVTFRPRVGTDLWLGEPQALTARGTVLDVEPLARGQRCGYRQHRAPSAGHLVVVSGGTAHGVALEAPKAVHGAASRAKVVAQGALEAAGRNLSPFWWAGKQRWFVEPPHMQVSLVFVPDKVEPPAIGDELTCRVRLTTTHADQVVDTDI